MNNLAKLWRRPSVLKSELPDRVYTLESTEMFAKYYDKVQSMLEKIAGLDEMLAGSIFMHYKTLLLRIFTQA